MSSGPPIAPAALAERFLELTGDIAGAIALDGTIVSVNPALARLLGATADEVVGATANDVLIHPDDRAGLIESWLAMTGGEVDTAEVEVRIGPAGDPRRWCVLSLTIDRDAGLIYLLGRDVHDRRLAAERASEADALFRSGFERSAIAMCLVTLDGRFRRVNAAYAQLVGRMPEQLVGMPVDAVVHPDDVADLAHMRRSLVDDPARDARCMIRYVRPGGREVWGALNFSSVLGPDGRPQHLFGQVVDRGDQHAAEVALADSERRFRALAAASPVGIFAATFDGRMLYANRRLGEIHGCSHFELDHGPWLATVTGAGRDALLAAGQEVRAGRGPVTVELELEPGPGRARWVRIDIAGVEDEREPYFLGTTTDVTAEVEARAELAAREAEFRLLAEHSGDVLSRHDAEGRYLYASPASERLFGLSPDQLVGRWASEVGIGGLGDDRAVAAELATRYAQSAGEAVTTEFHVTRPDGAERWVETALRVVDRAGASELVAVTRDVTARKRAEAELAHQALHDTLTGLPNRALFQDRLEQALRRARRRERGVAVLFVDLDRFKLINDSFGHAAGDRLLCDVAARLRAELRPEDTIARFGGDELTILCEDVAGEAGVRSIANRIAALFDEPFLVEDSEAFLQASIGIALADETTEPENLIRDADAAMYRAKDAGRGRIEVFDEDMRRDARARVATESALRRAIERDELRLHVQPVIELASGAIQGFEGLVRWQHPERGLVPPGEFIPLAEETGLIVPIGNWVVREVCRTLRRWHEELGTDWVQCSVNLSVRHLNKPDLVATVRDALAESGVPGHRLILEITESAVMENPAGTLETLRALKALGARMALDDFGTGYSSLARLHEFPFDILKVDRSFVAKLGDDQEGASIAGAIISLSRALGLGTCAEGIEDEAQLRAVARLGATHAQGFHIGRPAPPSTFDDALRAAERPS